MTIQVGSIVRAPRDRSKLKGRAVVALIQDEEDSVCILWEDLAPRPLKGHAAFLVSPMVPRSKEEKEDTIDASELSALLEFEQEVPSEDGCEVAVWKERGDMLLRLGDASAAIPYYEAGLAASSVLQVGSTGLVSQKDMFQVAEVDYLEDGNADVTIGDEERTISERNVTLCFLAGHETLQVRILLNLTRCLMQVAELEDSQMSAYYRRSAATACSMALAILDWLGESREQDTTSLYATALLLRSKAYASRSKWKLAMSDAKQLTTLHTDYNEGKTWLRQLELEVARQQKTNQKLAKSMCAWVQNATTADTSSGKGDREGLSRTDSVSQVSADQETASLSSRLVASPLTLFWYLFCPLLLAIWIHRLLTELNRKDNQFTS